jgi:hypothetical protein
MNLTEKRLFGAYPKASPLGHFQSVLLSCPLRGNREGSNSVTNRRGTITMLRVAAVAERLSP